MSKYLVLLASLTNYKLQGWLVQLFPLPVGVHGSLLHAHWIPALEAMGIPERHFQNLLQSAAVASVKVTHLLHVCCHKLCNTPETTSLRYLTREYAKEAWGPAPPTI